MKLKPLQDRILVQRIEEEKTTKGGIIIPDTAKEKPAEGKVVAVGNGKIGEDGKRIALFEIKKGDRILFGKYSGTEVKISGEDYLILREDDVLGIIEWRMTKNGCKNRQVSRPVDGSDPATEWQGVHTVDESPNVSNPGVGWIQNTNNWPYSAAGPDSPKEKDYPSYFDRAGENPRGIHAIRVLEGRSGFTLDCLVSAAYDSYLPAFADLLPPLLTAYDKLPASSPLRTRLAEPVQLLREWDLRWSVTSVPTSIAVFWGQELWRRARAAEESEEMPVLAYVSQRMPATERLVALADATDTLAARFGSWKTLWGEINRFQRLTGDIVQPFSDSGPSLPVGFTSAQWGSLASFGARTYPGTKKMYGTSGNSFVAVVEVGDSVAARAVTAGGQSCNPASPHFNDQAARYAKGDLRDVYFYPNQLKGHTERTYRPKGGTMINRTAMISVGVLLAACTPKPQPEPTAEDRRTALIARGDSLALPGAP